jgi:hypothetical protein
MKDRIWAKLIVGILAQPDVMEEAEQYLIVHLGRIEHRSRTIPFQFTDYYTREMGSPLMRRWVSLYEPVRRDELVVLKERARELERELARSDGSRRANLDPGLITGGSVVLASTKDAAHRILLDRGIFAEVTLIYRKGTFRSLTWTYPDYRTDEAITFCNQVRADLMSWK